MSCLQDWPEQIVRVQSLSDSSLPVIPGRYVKPPSERPSIESGADTEINIPLIDLGGLVGDDSLRATTMRHISDACKDWGFLQIVNHGISPDLMHQVREVWRQFFHLPIELKQVYANSPATYEGYGSRLGVEKGAILDWSDYFFLNYLPMSQKDHNKWPALPTSCRELIDKYCDQLVKLCGTLMKVFSINLGLGEKYLQNAFGGEDIGACLRANLYPKCPQPDLTLGISPHSDPGGMTLLLPDDHVTGLQVLSNAIYKSVEHRVIVNSVKERISLAFFYNPQSDLLIEAAKELMTADRPALYSPMTYNEYRLYIREKGLCGKSQMDSLKSLG
ncbi:hypothetical protein HHK36_010730 [Tetracentron sinense]|uniref:Fe2OG dioxygenase domain-containing protein n=1 Tax=Tetracentron sinense TaxID=13715 RepID=A0A834ZAX2_TETSI|nr:hypothetical protein HHK36_010730 [Tetracentron sinense]